MKIAIVGAGNVGKGLGRSLVRAGHDLAFATRQYLNIQMQIAQAGDWRTAFVLVAPPAAATAGGSDE